MTRKVAALGDEEIKQISKKVRARLEAKFSPIAVATFIGSNHDILVAFIQEAYIAVREKIEEQDL